MAQTLINPHYYNNLLNKAIDAMLNPQTTDTQSSLPTLYNLIQSRTNPPLESIWVYSNLVFSNQKSQNEKLSNRVTSLNDLFQLVCMCSASCTNTSSIVLLAPVIYKVYRVIVDVSKFEELGSKKEKRLMRKIESLVSVILGFISFCSSGIHNGDDSGEFIRPLEDLVRVWVGNGSGEDMDEKEMFKLFFPILGGELAGVGVDEVAGAVIAEAFLLRLCLDLHSGVSEQELRGWAVGSITGFKNFYFFDTLVKMLLEQDLPVKFLLSCENEATLRKILLDAVILVDYSFLNIENMIHLPANHILSLFISRVLVTNEATESLRKNKDLTKALAYINVFSSSRLPSQLVKVVSNMVSMETEADKPKGMSPSAILKWLHNLEDQGIRVLDDNILSSRARLVFDASEAENDISYDNSGKKHLDPEFGFYIDNKGAVEDENGDEDEDERGNESINDALVAAARTMKSDKNGGDRKRKERKGGEKRRRIKFQKYQLDADDSGEKPLSLRNNEGSSESEVEDPLADDVESEEDE